MVAQWRCPMLERIVFGIQATQLIILFFVVILLPVIVAFIDDAINYTSDTRKLTIIAVGYILMSIAFFAWKAPAHAAPVNAASIVRAKCLRTPPELRSPKCVRLVGR